MKTKTKIVRIHRTIRIKYHGPNAARGARFSAQAHGWGRRYYPRRYDLSPDQDAEAVAAIYFEEVWGEKPVGFLIGQLAPDEYVAIHILG